MKNENRIVTIFIFYCQFSHRSGVAEKGSRLGGKEAPSEATGTIFLIHTDKVCPTFFLYADL